MPDELRKFLNREVEELKQHKIRTVALVVLFVVLLIFWANDYNSAGEEINLSEPTADDAPPVSKNLSVSLPVEKSRNGVTFVIGANADELFIGDPFAGEEKTMPPPSPAPPPPKIPANPFPPLQNQPLPQIPKLAEEKIILMGTAITAENKMAMFAKGTEILFLTIGDKLNGRLIIDISPDFVTFEDGEVLTIRN